MLLSRESARLTFIGLAIVAGLGLVVALSAIVFAPRGAPTLLFISLAVVALVVIAEVVLLLLVSRPRKA